MPVNKVVFGAVAIMDISDSTVTPETLAEGETAYDKAGNKITGTMKSSEDLTAPLDAQEAKLNALLSSLDGKAAGGGVGKPEQEKTLEVTENGTYDVVPDEGYTLSGVSVEVAVPEREIRLQDKEVTENGEYTADAGYDGLGKVTVNVAAGGGAEDSLDDFLTNKVTAIDSDVTSIMSYGSYGRTALETVNLPKCTNINSYAFRGCSGITNVNIPLVTTLGSYAFYGCSSLAVINAPNVKTLGTYAFYKCDLQSVDFPLATSIAQNSFFQNVNLQRADFGAADKIAQAAFGNCESLVTLILRRTGSICALQVATNAFSGTPIANGTGYVYVPAALIETYKTATNWVNYASQFRALEDYPEITGG